MDRLKLVATDAKTWSGDSWGAWVIGGEILRCAQNDGAEATATVFEADPPLRFGMTTRTKARAKANASAKATANGNGF